VTFKVTHFLQLFPNAISGPVVYSRHDFNWHKTS